MKKKGLSEVISMTLIILLVIVVGASIYTFSSNFINTQKGDLDSSLNPYLSVSIDDVSIEMPEGLASSSLSPSQKITITITRTDNQDKDILGVRFILTDKSGNNKIYDSLIPPAETGVSKTYEITNIQLNIADFSNIDKVSISFLLAENKPTQILAEKILE